MPVFAYKAVDLDASAVDGTLIADTSRQARDMLRERGLTITSITSAESPKATGIRPFGRGGSRHEIVEFIREVATLLAAGIPLHSALETLAEQHGRPMKAIIQQLADRIAAGDGLAEAMKSHPTHFGPLVTSMVAVGESTGSLATALKRLADFQEKAHRLRSRVTSALIYPAVVSVLGLCVCIFLMTYVVPNLLNALTEAGKELPPITQFVKTVSDLLVHGWWAIILGVAAMVAAFMAILRTPRGRHAIHAIVLKIPLVGKLIRKDLTSRMAVILSALLRSGLQFIDAVRITRGTLRNVLFQQALEDYEVAVAAGKDVAEPLKNSGVFPPMVVQMLAVGQQSGELEAMLDQLAESYDQQVQTATQRLTAALEPLMLVVLAIFVGFIALATILPILEASNVL